MNPFDPKNIFIGSLILAVIVAVQGEWLLAFQFMLFVCPILMALGWSVTKIYTAWAIQASMPPGGIYKRVPVKPPMPISTHLQVFDPDNLERGALGEDGLMEKERERRHRDFDAHIDEIERKITKTKKQKELRK